MASNLDDCFSVCERRLQVVGQVAGALSAAKPARPEAMIEFLERRTAELCGLVAEWTRIEASLKLWRERSPELFTKPGPAVPVSRSAGASRPVEWARGPDFRQFLRLLEQLQWQCRVETAVLRRSRRTAAALSALLAGTEASYPAPS